MNTPLVKSNFFERLGERFLFLSLAALLFTAPVRADVVIVESREGGMNLNAYAEGDGNWFGSSVKSSAPGTTPGIGSRFATTNLSGTTQPFFQVDPILGVPGGRYLVEVTHATSANIPVDLIVSNFVVGGTGLPETTSAFDQLPDNVWRTVGTLQLDPGVSQPTVVFSKLSGSGVGQRFYADAIRFTEASDPCLSALPQLTTVNGPLAAGQTFVIVPNVNSNATRVRVYADGTLIGETTTGVTEGTNTVTTSALVKGQILAATQADSTGVDSCLSSTGPIVGGGANPAIRIVLSIRQDMTLTGPIGAPGGTAGPVKYLGADGVVGGFGTAPNGGVVVTPSTCWQTVMLERGPDPASPVDPTYLWAGSDVTNRNELHGDFGTLDSIAIGIEDLTDSGPYAIYIDNLMNGDTLIQGFEGTNAGAVAVTFNQPSFSGTTSPFLLAQPLGQISPNISRVSNENADTGTNSAFISWQFKDTAAVDWLRLVAQGSDVTLPQLNLNLPISFRILLLPVGETTSGPPFSISRNGTMVTVTWNDDCYALQSTTTVTGMFQDVVGATSPHVIDVSTAPDEQYFRLRSLDGQ